MSSTFNYETLGETERAILVKIPYWEATNETKSKHKQFYFECWLPKISIENGTAYHIALKKIEERRLSMPIQRLYDTPPKYKTLGQYAPAKEKHISIVPDLEKIGLMKRELMSRHNISNYDRGFFISPDPNVSEDDRIIAMILRNPEDYKGNPIIPTKKVITYK